jgi:predicted transcriptional regulator
MADDGRVVTAKLPDDLVDRMDQVAHRIERTKSWIVREALSQWLAEEQRRYELTLEGLKDFDEGRVLSQDEMEKWVVKKKRDARTKSAA